MDPWRMLKSQRIRNLIPARVKAAYAENRVWLLPIARQTSVTNVYHCCVHKTGSQWIRKVLADPVIYRRTGLRTYAPAIRQEGGFDPRDYGDRRYPLAPPRRIVSPLYVNYSGFANMPKPAAWRAIFVMRDPRDLVVSWYFSTLHSHPARKGLDLESRRRALASLDEEQGLIYAIQWLAGRGLFDAVASWTDGRSGPDALILRYEDLVGPDADAWWARLLDHCDMRIDATERAHLLDRYSFESLSGRPRGQEDRGSKYRKGVPGDWREHFTSPVLDAFAHTVPDLPAKLGYEE